jgi:alpha-glucosidase
VWLGDNRSSWDQLLASIPMALGMGLSGVPFVGADVGGWDDDCTGELLIRWMQLGAFLPFFRNHCALDRHAQEPWAFGPEVEARCREAIELRYRLLPYLERQFEDAHRTGLPIARPLWLEFPQDRACADLADQFLVGPDVLVAPAYQPGMRARAVYLPPGTWIEFHDRAALAGGRWIMAAAPLDRIPLFVRDGAIVPMLKRTPQHAAWTDADVVRTRFKANAPSEG